MNDEIKTLHELTAGINKLQVLTNERRGKQTSCTKQPNRSVRTFNKFTKTEQSIAASVASANPDATSNIPCEKATVATMFFFFSHKLTHINRAENWWISKKAFKIRNGAHSIMTNDISWNRVN